MRVYSYRCECGYAAEARQKMDCKEIPCLACGKTAQRAPFSGVPYLIGETVARSIPNAVR